jgi:hypothetical protein
LDCRKRGGEGNDDEQCGELVARAIISTECFVSPRRSLGYSITELASLVAERTGRSVEGVRTTIQDYEADGGPEPRVSTVEAVLECSTERRFYGTTNAKPQPSSRTSFDSLARALSKSFEAPSSRPCSALASS